MDTQNWRGEDNKWKKTDRQKATELFCIFNFLKKLSNRGIGTNSTEAASRKISEEMTSKLGEGNKQVSTNFSP